MSRLDRLRHSRPGHSRRPVDDVEREIRDEVAFHIEMRVRDNLDRGMAEDEAWQEAMARFGDLEHIAGEMRLVRRGSAFGRLAARAGHGIRDLQFAWRVLSRRPAFTAVTVLTLAIGIAGATTVFSVANWFVLRDVPGLRNPEPLVAVTIGMKDAPDATWAFSHRDYLDIREGAPALEGLAAATAVDVHVWPPRSDAPRRIGAEIVSDNWAEVQGLVPLRGRTLRAEDRARPQVAMISDRLWSELFARSPDALGSSVSVNGTPFTIVGVAPEGFRGVSLLASADIWVPIEAHETIVPILGRGVLSDRRSAIWMRLIGRLAPGATIDRVSEQLQAGVTRIAEIEGSLSDRAQAVVLEDIALMRPDRERLTSIIRILGAGVFLLLLLACANAANLLLGRFADRRSELAVRLAIGAGRGRLIRQLVVEALLLVGAGGLAGVALTAVAVGQLRGQRILTWIPEMTELGLDGGVLLFALGVSAATGLVFGVVPAFIGTRSLSVGTRTASRRSLSGPSRTLVVAQVGMSLTLLIGAGLLLQTVRSLAVIDLGFDPTGVLEASVDPGTQGYDAPERTALFNDLLLGARELPGVRAAALSWSPVQGRRRMGGVIRAQGLAPSDERVVYASSNWVSTDFVEALGLELVSGRGFREDEMFTPSGRLGAVIVTESLARRLFPGADAIGRRVAVGSRDTRILEVIGVVADARLGAVKESGAAFFVEPFGQHTSDPGRATIYVRGSGAGPPAAESLLRLIGALDPSLPLFEVQPLFKRVETNVAMERTLARLTSVFAVVSLVLAAVGLYGVLTISVRRRTREMGIRVALGARSLEVRRMVLRQGLALTSFGVVLGIVGASQATRLVASRLWGVRPLDPSVFGGAALLLVTTAVIACWIPAARATRVDPIVALKQDT